MRPYLTTLLVSFLFHTGFVQSTPDRRDAPVGEPASGHVLDLSSPVNDTKPTRLLHGHRALDVTKKDDPESASSLNLGTQESLRYLLDKLYAVSHCESASSPNLRTQESSKPLLGELHTASDRLKSEKGRIEGENFFVTDDLCGFSCATYGCCPESLCDYDVLSVDLNHLCNFTCRYGYCPPQKACQETLDKAKEENRTSNYGCILWTPESEGGLKSISWQRQPSTGRLVTGSKCSCDNWPVNDLVDYFIEALPAIAQIGCFILISALKLIIDVGLSIFGGKTLTAGVDMALTAVELTNYVYSKEEDPLGAFQWWLNPCGGSHLVPAEIKQTFDILSFAPRDKSSYKEPTKIKKHSGKKGDEGNPRSKPDKSTGVASSKSKSSNTCTKECSIRPEDQTKTVGMAQNTLEIRSCNSKDETVTEYSVVSTMTHEPLATRPKVKVNCSAVWNQSCHNYSAVIQESSRWSTFTLH
ncbi:hypothetical protein NCS52_00429400 [Fusarium sp. LHS14.1]|nr:hypothetical protein NCS52_00429400 [Fusarium sp. LHS14.1]